MIFDTSRRLDVQRSKVEVNDREDMNRPPRTLTFDRTLGTLLLALGVGLGGCIGHHEPDDQRVIVFKHGKLAGDERRFDQLLREFEQRHPGVTVQNELLPSSTDQQHQFYAINLEGRQPAFDLFAVDVIWAQEFARAGWIQNLDAFVPVNRDEFFAAAIAAATYRGSLYAVPWYLDAGVLFYRRDLLARYGFAPPQTWSELVKSTARILEGEQDPSLKGFLWTGKQYEGLVCVALEFIWSHGGTLFETEADLSTKEAQVRLAAAGRALGFMRELIVSGVSPPTVATTDEETARHLFADGRAVYMRNWPYAWTLLQQTDSPVRARVGLAPLPSAPGERSASALGGWLLAIPTGARHAQDAAELLKFLVSPAVQRRMAIELGYKPAYRKLYRDPVLLEVQPWLTELYPVYESARPRLVSPYYLMLSQIVQPELSAAVVGRKRPDDALKSVRHQIKDILSYDSAYDSFGGTIVDDGGDRRAGRRMSTSPSPNGRLGPQDPPEQRPRSSGHSSLLVRR
jgi:multiple sugar transport system substrate-binding protein